MVTNINEALDGLRNGELTLSEISMDLRSNEEVAITAIKEYGESAITFLTATNSLPHTPEIFITILESLKLDISKKIKSDVNFLAENFDEELDIDKLMEQNSNLSIELTNIETAIKALTVHKDKLFQNMPEKGGQEH